jgi:hypothetical protein
MQSASMKRAAMQAGRTASPMGRTAPEAKSKLRVTRSPVASPGFRVPSFEKWRKKMRVNRTAAFVSIALPTLALLTAPAFAGCTSDAEKDAGASDAATGGSVSDRPRLDAPYHPDAPCAVTIETPELLPGQHVPVGTAITWSSNPPSSGPHFPIWAAYQTFTTPVERGYYVHDLEHGAVVFLYKCGDPGGCPEIAAGLQQVVDSLPADPLCTDIADTNGGVRVRAVLTPDPLIDVPVAAVAWGWTYKASCLDPTTLRAFATDHYGQGTEHLCVNGQTGF